MSGTAQPNVTVEIFDGSTSYGTTTASAAGTWSRAITIQDGTYLLTARARNLAGASLESAMRVVFVDSHAPSAPAITAPAANSQMATAFTVTGSAEAGTTVEGTITAKATDFAGNASSLSAGQTLRVG